MNGMVEPYRTLVSGRIVKKAIHLYFPNMLNDFKSEIEKRFKEGGICIFFDHIESVTSIYRFGDGLYRQI